MTQNTMELKKIAAIGNLIEAQVLESILEEREIPFRLRSFHDTAYDGLFQFQKGWGEIYARAEHEKDILEILNAIRSSNATDKSE